MKPGKGITSKKNGKRKTGGGQGSPTKLAPETKVGEANGSLVTIRKGGLVEPVQASSGTDGAPFMKVRPDLKKRKKPVQN